jgi:hypothetical protein
VADMIYKRQAHGMLLVNNYVYCCGGLTGTMILDSCERYNIENIGGKDHWQQDLPALECPKFSMTMLLMDNKWIYSFGGAAVVMLDNGIKGFEVERLNTSLVDNGTLTNKDHWERILIKYNFDRCC